MKNRMISQDIVKGLAILIVCQLHTLQLSKMIFYPLALIFGYVMPVFMFLSGYNYRQKQIPPLEMIKKRIGTILKKYLTWCLIVFVVMGSYYYFRGIATLKEILMSFCYHLLSVSGCKMLGINLPVTLFRQILGPCWFIQYLVSASIIFYLCVDYAYNLLNICFQLSLL